MAEESASQSVYPASYAAFFAPRTHKFETVDFRVPASLANLEHYFPASTKQLIARGRLAGLLGVAVGVVFALIGFAVDQLTRGLTIGLYTAAERLLNRDQFWPAAIVFILICIVFVAIAACMVVYIAPLGAGSGIPELKSYLNGVRIPGFLSINSLFVKAAGICFSISSGLICGKQGPMIHAGAITGAGMSQAASSRFHWRLESKHFQFLRTEAWKRDFCAAGAAIGVAVAFGSPMGAWMWVYEEACTHWTWDLGIITLGGCLSGAAVARFLNYLAAGIPNGGFGNFTLTEIGKLVTPTADITFWLKDVPGYALLGVIGGVCGAILPIVNKSITLFRYKKITKPVPRIFEAILIGALTAILRVIIPYLANDCREMNDELKDVLKSAPLGDYSRFVCPDSQFSPWAATIYNPTDSVVRGLLFSHDSNLFPAGAIAVAFVYYFVFIVWTYGVAVPAGVFFPGFLLGSVYGRLIGTAVQAIFPARTDTSLTAYAFLGSVSALAGITRTISVAVIALEATGGYEASFPAVFVAVVAKLVGDVLYKLGIYDLHIELKGIPFLRSNVPRLTLYQQVRLFQVMESNVIGVRRLSSLGGLVRMLRTNDHHAFPVFVKLIALEEMRKASSTESVDAPKNISDRDVHDPDNLLPVSRTSILEAELDEKEYSSTRAHRPFRIITAAQSGLQATIFDEGVARVLQLTENGDVQIVSAPTPTATGWRSASKSSAESSTSRTLDNGELSDAESPKNKIPDFELVGTIDRGTLLALIKHECDREMSSRASNASAESHKTVCREELDAAWPNSSRMKGTEEASLLSRVGQLGLTDEVVDLKRYIDPDPLLMSDRAMSMTAYGQFRKTGARHILVTDMRSGRVSGIVTRKDVLLESIEDVIGKMKDVKVQ